MIRLFLPPEWLTSKKITITGEDARYLSLVLRIQPEDFITVFDGLGHRYVCRILQVHKKQIIAEKTKEEMYTTESPLSITIAQGIPKSDRMDLIIQKSTELGVKRIIPLITERSQIRSTGKTGRWRKIALSASQQSGREKVPHIEEPLNFEEFLNPPFSKGGIGGLFGIIFSEEEKERNLRRVLNDFKNVTDIVLLIGPEGGFSKEEADIAVNKGFAAASLGPRILRTETAAITAVSIIQYELGDIGLVSKPH